MEEKGMLDERIPLQLLGSCQEAAGKLPGSCREAPGKLRVRMGVMQVWFW